MQGMNKGKVIKFVELFHFVIVHLKVHTQRKRFETIL